MNASSKTTITKELLDSHGLSSEEYSVIKGLIGRDCNITELGIFSVMWSEHCSYKSSKVWLRSLPTEAPWVICGPGENAGVVDIGDGEAAIFKIESHNHPSFIEPYQGAATGVGGIMRDIFTMGARPIANLNCLRFGEPSHSKTRYLLDRVVAGIGNYGNSMGVPTVAGECTFDRSYNGNILVNAMTVGIADKDKIFYSTATGVGNLVVYVGSKTGRDGIHGATMASSEFGDSADEKRPTVQVGDPFIEKLLLEACLELMATEAIIAIQDMGAAGLTSSAFEMASKGGMGMELNLDDVPKREKDMTPYEVMLSESQERMLMVVSYGQENKAREIFKKWELDFAIIGKLTDTGRMVISMNGELAADLPIQPLANASPEYKRPWIAGKRPADLHTADIPSPEACNVNGITGALELLISSPDLSSKRWLWEQYDYLVRGNTIQRPGGDAAVMRLPGTSKGLAVTADCTPRYCAAYAREGASQAVAESWRNLTATGARPLAITDCMNYGSPDKPIIMGQFVESIKGMKEACEILKFPVVSGNVSFYNETNGEAIHPSPVIGAIGVIDNIHKMVTIGLKLSGNPLIVIGKSEGHLGASLYLRDIAGQEVGPPPAIDLPSEKRNGDFVREQINKGRVSSCHDVSDGGILVAIAEMALASDSCAEKAIGAEIYFDDKLTLHAAAFGEDQGRYVLEAPLIAAKEILAAAKDSGIPASQIGHCAGTALTINERHSISLERLRTLNENWLPEFMMDSRP